MCAHLSRASRLQGLDAELLNQATLTELGAEPQPLRADPEGGPPPNAWQQVSTRRFRKAQDTHTCMCLPKEGL